MLEGAGWCYFKYLCCEVSKSVASCGMLIRSESTSRALQAALICQLCQSAAASASASAAASAV
jgi:hypothetical protein